MEFSHNFVLYKENIDFPKTEDDEFGKDILWAGLLGNDYFAGKQLVIDFPNTRFAILNERDFKNIQSSFNLLDAILDKYFYIHLNYEKPIRVMYDSGASIIPLILFNKKELWEELTTAKVIETLHLSAGFDDKIKLTGAVINKDLSLLTVNLNGQLAYFEDSETSGYGNHFLCDGLIGNVLFYDKHTIMLDYKNNKFGIFNI